MNEYDIKNRKQIREIFEKGCKQEGSPFTLGLELEHFLIDEQTKRAVDYYGDKGVSSVLKRLIPCYDHVYFSEGKLIGLEREDIALSLEPAAQLEVSFIPRTSMEEIEKSYQRFLSEINPILSEWGISLYTCGYQPFDKVNDLTLLPKKRYEFMDQYFAQIGPYGRQMMRGTAATQVSVDYYSEEDFSKKYFVALVFAPILALISENTPNYEGAPNQHKMLRQWIWENTDKNRVSVLPFLKNGTLDFDTYLQFLYQTEVIVDEVRDKDIYSEQTIGEICRERFLSAEESMHMLSMVFPMVRLKNYLEIRVADSMPFEQVRLYLLYIKGIFGGIESAYQLANQIMQQCPAWLTESYQAICQDGIEAKILCEHSGELEVRNILGEMTDFVISQLEEKERKELLLKKSDIIKYGTLL